MVENLRSLKKKGVQIAFCFIESPEPLTANQQNKLTSIMKLNIAYYSLGKNRFKTDFKRGESFAKE